MATPTFKVLESRHWFPSTAKGCESSFLLDIKRLLVRFIGTSRHCKFVDSTPMLLGILKAPVDIA